jgi:hypothetical protein
MTGGRWKAATTHCRPCCWLSDNNIEMRRIMKRTREEAE